MYGGDGWSCINRLSERDVNGREANRRIVFGACGVCKSLLSGPDASFELRYVYMSLYRL